jgi:hypothetical protein
VPRRRGESDPVASIREVDPSAADALAYIEDLVVRIRGEARALGNRIVAGAATRPVGGGRSRGGGSGGPLAAVDRLDEIRVGLQRVVAGTPIE